MQKCDFSKVALELFRGHTSTWVFSCELAAYLYFDTPLLEYFWRVLSKEVVRFLEKRQICY